MRQTTRRQHLTESGLGLAAYCFGTGLAGAQAAQTPARKWLPSTAYCVPKETAPEGEGYFSIVTGRNGRLYVGTHANAVNAWLVEFDPANKAMAVVVDAHKEIGTNVKGFAAQAKIHTRNNVGASGKIYFGTKQGYPSDKEKREDYPGGYPMVYDPATGKTKVYPIPVPHHGINSITPDESRGIAYVSTCADGRPGPGENSIFLILDLNTGKYRSLMDTRHFFGFIVIDHLGRAYHPILGGDIARYDPRTDKLERLKQSIDGKTPTPEHKLALPNPDPINWDITPDGKTLYAQPMTCNGLFSYDLTATGDTIPGRSLGTLVAGAKAVDCRAMCVGPKGDVWSAITEEGTPEVTNLLHLVTYRAGDKSPTDLGCVSVRNPDYTEFTDKGGKPLPFHSGLAKLADGTWTTRHVILGVSQAQTGKVYALMLCPYTVLEIDPPARV
jgi:sugar lactone lactonase YvrE